VIRPPSLQRSWDEYFTGDPAIFQPPPPPPDDASDEIKKAHKEAIEQYIAKIRSARETGNWMPVVVEGQIPTKFTLHPVDRNIWRAIMDRAVLPSSNPRHIGEVTLHALLVRLSLRNITGFEQKIERLPDPNWDNWVMAQASIITTLDEIDPRIIGELGSSVFRRLQGISPKP
jgi:hypothetical protein